MPTGRRVPDAIPLIAQNPQIAERSRASCSSCSARRCSCSERYGEKHPALQNVNAQLADTQRQLDLEVTEALQTVKNDYDTAVLEERTLSQNLEAAKADAQDLSRKSVGYNVMEREAKSNRAGLRIAAAARKRAARLEQQPREQRAARRPRRSAEIADGADRAPDVVAVVRHRAGRSRSRVAFGLDYMNDTIKTPEDVTRRLKLPFLGLVPSVRGDKHPLLASSHVPHDFGEAFRVAADVADLAAIAADGTKTLIVTSAQPLEGKTTTACNIAMALAYGGARVLLIDARHAPARAAPPAAADQRARPVAGADRPGARARRHSAHGRSEPAGDHRRPARRRIRRSCSRPSA